MTRPVISMSKALRQSTKGGIIAEFKRRSPSKGWINEAADARSVIGGYRKMGAAACSVLTNEEFFGGSLEFLKLARAVAGDMPLLRKEFIIDERQIFEARVAGADAVLLIAAALSVEECYRLSEVAHSVGLEVLLEIHSEDELSHFNKFVDMLGVNNRNLGSFVTDINNSFRLAEHMRERGGDVVLVSESGIDSSQTIKKLADVGFRGFLIGETFMRTAQPDKALEDLINELC
ncbi:MAG: indole-3-glycerol phosphate synthase TrpC [Rikenellaceae bacterium]